MKNQTLTRISPPSRGWSYLLGWAVWFVALAGAAYHDHG